MWHQMKVLNRLIFPHRLKKKFNTEFTLDLLYMYRVSHRFGPKFDSIFLKRIGAKKNLILEIIFKMLQKSSNFEFWQMSRLPQLSFNFGYYCKPSLFFYMSSENLEKCCPNWVQIDGTPCTTLRERNHLALYIQRYSTLGSFSLQHVLIWNLPTQLLLCLSIFLKENPVLVYVWDSLFKRTWLRI